MNKKTIKIIISICVITAIVVFGVYASRDMTFLKWGQQQKEIINNKDLDNIIAKVNGIAIYQSKFDSYKTGLSNTNVKFSDEEILRKIIEQEVIMQEIVRLGYTVTNSEVEKFNEERFALLETDSQAYQIVRDYVDGLGITMEEYKEMSKEISKTALLANKYKEDIRKEFVTQNSQLSAYSDKDKVEKFEEYFAQKTDSLYDNAKIEILK